MPEIENINKNLMEISDCQYILQDRLIQHSSKFMSLTVTQKSEHAKYEKVPKLYTYLSGS